MHSIIITHRNRHANLGLCVWSVQRSARLCGVDDYEIVVVDNGSTPPPTAAALTTGTSTPRPAKPSYIRIVHDQRDMPIFNVPSFDDPSHVRWLSDASEVATRYGQAIHSLKVETLLRYFFLGIGTAGSDWLVPVP